MRSTLKKMARDWLPSVVKRKVNRLLGRVIRFEGDFASWDDARAHSDGYDAEGIHARVLAATLEVREGRAAFERDSVLFDEIEYAWPVLSGLLWAAARSGGMLNVLDMGGALGSGYFQNRRFLQALPDVRWNVVEQAHFVASGKRHIQDEKLCFYQTIEDCLEENSPNVIVLSSVLQYLQSPIEVIEKLNRVGAMCLIIDRTPFRSGSRDTLVIQKVPATVYSASYPMWIFSRPEFMRILAPHWCPVITYASPEGCARTESGLDFGFEGMLLESRP